MKNAIHMLKTVTGTQMNSFLIATESGKIIAIDGGFRQDAPYFLQYLRELTQTDVPHIDAWFLTHPHRDHIYAFTEIMENHLNELTVGNVYFNFPSIQFIAREEPTEEETMRDFFSVLPRFADKIRICSGGDRYTIGEAQIDVLYSTDFELNRNVGNNASLVFRMTLGGKTALFTGDCGVEAGRKVLRLWKDRGMVKADICQMAHHGQNGCEREFYEAVAPSVCLWCTPQWLWDNDAGEGYNTHIWQTVVVRGWMDELGVKTHYVIKDGTQVCEL